MNRGRFKTEINHSVTQPVIHPSFLFFKVYLTYKLLFGLDQISFTFEVFGIVKTKLDFLQFFSAHFLPKSHSRYCRPSCTKVDVNSIQFNSFFYLTYTEYYVHKVKMILQYYLASSQQNEQLTCTFLNLFFFFSGPWARDKSCKYLLASGNHNIVYLRPFCASTGLQLPLGKKKKKDVDTDFVLFFLDRHWRKSMQAIIVIEIELSFEWRNFYIFLELQQDGYYFAQLQILRFSLRCEIVWVTNLY